MGSSRKRKPAEPDAVEPMPFASESLAADKRRLAELRRRQEEQEAEALAKQLAERVEWRGKR